MYHLTQTQKLNMSLENKRVTFVVDCGEDPNANTIFIENMFLDRIFNGSNNSLYSINRSERGSTEEDLYNVYTVVFCDNNAEVHKMREEIKRNAGVLDYTYIMIGKTSEVYTWKIAEVIE